MKKKRTIPFLLGGLGVLAVAAVILNFSFRRNRYDSSPPVRAHEAARGALEDVVTGNGSFRPRVSVGVVPQVAGEVERLLVKEGDRVPAGALLLQIRDDDYRLAVQKARSGLESARRGVSQSLVTLRAQYRSALSAQEETRRAYEKNRELAAAKAIAEEILQRSEDAYRSAREALQSAREQLALRCGLPLSAEPPLDSAGDEAIIEASPEVSQASLALQSAQDSLGKCRITAPVAGTVTTLKPAVGDFLPAMTPVLRLESIDDMLAEIQIDEVDIGKLHVGQAAEVTSDSIIGRTLQARVQSIAPTVTTLGSSRVTLVDLAIGPTDAPLKSGASCSARITASIKADSLLIPLASFFTEEGLSYVYVLVPGGQKNSKGAEVFKLEKREIKTGSSNVSFIEVVSGLQAGERIAIGNLKILRDGIHVILRSENDNPARDNKSLPAG